MYAYITRERFDTDVDFELNDKYDVHEIHSWRKHPDLHGWLEQRYRLKGGQDEIFNCSRLKLDRHDLEELERAIRNRLLPKTTGFFFGESERSEITDDLEFIAKGRQAIAEGFTLIYDSWWQRA